LFYSRDISLNNEERRSFHISKLSAITFTITSKPQRHISIHECAGEQPISSKYYEEHVPKMKRRNERLPAAVLSGSRDERKLLNYENMGSRLAKATHLCVKMDRDFMEAMANVYFKADV